MGQIIIGDFFNRPNNREIRQSRLSVSGHWFEPEISRIQGRVYTVFWYRFLYKISEDKQWLPSVTWSFSRINFIVSLICASYNRNVVLLNEVLYEIAASMGLIIICAFVWTYRITVKIVSQYCLFQDMDSYPWTLTYRADSIRCFRYRFLYNISDVKKWLPSVTWSFSLNIFIV